ncbi:glycoside hydrolase family 2 TIM barrel-domain containing protein [Pseudoclavibacter terrae]|uniref:DUF4982 domain-containing protein n=1 Tax=Pseudoclavibacter terrae TaxID=1530195 RepID=A0A7J5B0A2_9MICO|nr:glycoside hydrolase family 2 TIM barrel-domain containing protein [Pseudoclavibacter terrae]KAB1637293.1 DUF4982 domain-containing protein [Pseudoclavibacter terrae]
MAREPFNRGWTVKPKTSIFAQIGGAGSAGVEVDLPHDALFGEQRSAANSGKNAYFPSGTYEYSKSFDVPAEYRGKRVSVEFQGVYRDAVVFVNNAYAGQRPFGYSAFTVDLDDHLEYGTDNTIRVEVRSHDDSRWYAGAGLYRDVTLIVTDLVKIANSGPRVTTPDIDADRSIVELAVPLENHSPNRTTPVVSTEIRDGQGALVASGTTPTTLRAGAAATARLRLHITDPNLWSVDTPHLYTAVTTLVDGGTEVDSRSTTFGVRRLQLDPIFGLRINGVATKLRGACIHHDNGLLGAAAIRRAEERKIELLKNAGFNAIRMSHNPASSALLDACDRLGMLVMDETFDIWTESKSSFDYSLSFPEWWERDIEAFVAKDFNHPSVIFYSIGNEIPDTGNPLGSEWGRRLSEKVRELDDTRFITNGVNGFVSTLPTLLPLMKSRSQNAEPEGGVNGAGEMMNQVNASELVTKATEESFGVLDAAGLNYGDSRYELDKELFPNRVIIGTETFPPNIDRNWKLVQEHDHVLGDFTWTGWDYLGEVGIGRNQFLDEQPQFEAPFPWLTAWCGDLDLTGFRRPASYYREIVFGLRTAPYLAVLRPEAVGRDVRPGQWAWSESIASWDWAVDEQTPMQVEVYSPSESVELVVNGRSVGTAQTGPDNRFRATFDLPYERGTIEAFAIVGGERAASVSLRSHAGTTALSVSTDRSTLDADGGDLAYVDIELRDADGVLATSELRQVSVRVEGARLVALGSGKPDNTERFDAQTHATFDGRLQAIIRPTGPGPITVTINADAAEAVTLQLAAR